MKSEELKRDSRPWLSAWDRILNSELAIRSLLQFGEHKIVCDLEVFFLNGDGVFHNLRIHRDFGVVDMYFPAPIMGRIHNTSLSILGDYHERWKNTLGLQIADSWIIPYAHKTVIIPTVGVTVNSTTLLHPSLQSFYGMALETMERRRRMRKGSNGKEDSSAECESWDLVVKRFRRFFYNQQRDLKTFLFGVPLVVGESFKENGKFIEFP